MNISTANIEKLMAEGKRKREKDKKSPFVLAVFEPRPPTVGNTNSAGNRTNKGNNNNETKTNNNNNSNKFEDTNIGATYNTNTSGSNNTSTTNNNSLHISGNRNATPSVTETENVFTLVSGSESQKNRPLFEYMCSKSDILLLEDTSRLLQMLPQSLIFEGLELAFSTTRCGWALASLYAEVKDMRPCVLLIQTIPNLKPKKQLTETSQGHMSPARMSDEGQIGMTSQEVINSPNEKEYNAKSSHNSLTSNSFTAGIMKQIAKDISGDDVVEDDDDDDKSNFTLEDDIDRGTILGVYLPCSLSPPSTSVRGDPEAFVFRLTDGLINPSTGMPLGQKGVKFQSYIASHMSSNKKNNAAPPSSETAIINQYAVCASSYMSFGASSKHATNAIRIDEEMRWIASGPSDTYNSPSLLALNECDQGGFLSPLSERRGSVSNYMPPLSRRPSSRSRSNSNTNDGVGSVPGGPPSPTPLNSSYGYSHTNSLTLNVSVPALSISTSGNLSSSNAPSGLSSPVNPLTNSNNAMFELDRKAGIKQIEVWCARNSYNSMISMKKKTNNPHSSR